jgi:hypothetical protein
LTSASAAPTLSEGAADRRCKPLTFRIQSDLTQTEEHEAEPDNSYHGGISSPEQFLTQGGVTHDEPL